MLQFITDGKSVEEIVQQCTLAIKGGCRWIQVRMKDATDDDVRSVVQAIKPICQSTDTTLILDDRVALAHELGADGVHLGKEDMSPADARNILGAEAIIGSTANTIEDVVRLAQMPIDYFGIGPFHFTSTKKRLAPTLGLEGYRKIMTEMRSRGINLPVVAIGGITVEDVPSVMQTGVTGIAISGAIAHAEKPDEAARRFLDASAHAALRNTHGETK